MQDKTRNTRPIGVMDSGVGGISVLKHIHQQLPNENLIYFADSHHAPYGDKTPKQIENRVYAVAKFLLTHGAKALVIACNTATAATAQKLREKYAFLDLPIIAMEPAIKPAAATTKTGLVGVLATASTLRSTQFSTLLDSYGQHIEVHTQACTGLVECIERGELNTESTKQLLTQYCMPLLEKGADTLVLGCTHYPFVRDIIQEIVGDNIQVIDTGAAVAKHLDNMLQQKSLTNTANEQPSVTIWTNSKVDGRELVIQQLWGNKCIEVKRVR